MSKTIAVAMIVKNEEALLARCLESVKWVENLYILDTGSQDSTIEVALRYTSNVFIDSVWIADFAYHQNLIKSRVIEDVIISIDADEMLLSSEEDVREAVEKMKDVLRVTMVAEGDEQNQFGFIRIFRNTPEIRWEASIHKHLNVPGEGEEIGNIRIMYGRSPAHDLDPDRSLRMLEAAVSKEENIPRNLYYLGREYWYKERYQDCIDTFQKYIKIAHWQAELADAFFIMSQAYAALNMAEECAINCFQAILTNSNFKEAIQYMESMVLPENKPQWARMARAASNEGLIWKRIPAEPVNDSIALIPHNDDEALFLSYTIQREKPLCIVVTDSYIQPERGDVGCTAEIRRQETIEAMKIAGCPVVFLGIKDTELTADILRERLKGLTPEKVYAPAIQGGNAQHDIVGKVALELFGDRCKLYTTYTKTELHTTGTLEIKPTDEEWGIKSRMLDCYRSQVSLPSTKPHFFAVLGGKSEWFDDTPITTPLKKVIITPFFGDLPEWFDKFTPPKGYRWMLDTDLEKFKSRVKRVLGIDYPGLPGTGKVWDYRCALGLLYAEELKGVDYWGHCDFDIVFGDMDKFLPDSELSKLDVYSSHDAYVCGCFSMYRNCPEVNNLFKNYGLWHHMLQSVVASGWVETEYSRVLELSGLRYKYDLTPQGDPFTDSPVLSKDGNDLFQKINGEWREIGLFHFRRSKHLGWPLQTPTQ